MKVLTTLKGVYKRRFSSRPLPFPMRSWFFPKKSKSSLEKSVKLKPDIICLDLEDSVAVTERPGVRKLYLEALKDGIFSNMNVFLRISSSHVCEKDVQEDIQTFVGTGIKGFILPKVECPQSVKDIDGLVSQVEKEKGVAPSCVKFSIIAESATAYFLLDKIASASKRNIVLGVGHLDLTAETLWHENSPTFDTYLGKAVLAARSVGIASVWGAYDKIDDHTGFEKLCLKLKQCGFTGVVAVTPKQITMANCIFSMSPREKIWVDSVLEMNSNHAGLKLFKPSVQESRQIIAPPHVSKALRMKNEMKQLEKGTSSSIVRGIVKSKGIPPDTSIGDIIQSLVRMRVGEGLKSAWERSFGDQGGITRLEDVLNGTIKIVPFALAATITGALSVSSLSYHARVHLSLGNIFQHRALNIDDTVHALCRVEKVEPKKGSDNNLYSVVSSTHWLVNQNNDVVLQFGKVTMFSSDDCKINHEKNTSKLVQPIEPNNSLLRKSILQHPVKCFLPLSSNLPLSAGQLLVHDFVKVMGHSEMRTLCVLLNIVNPHVHDVIRYSSSDLLIPGPLVMAATITNSAMDLGEIIYEEIPLCHNTNKVNFGDQIGTLTYVAECGEVKGKAGFEQLTVKHIGIKNFDMEILSQMNIPSEVLEIDNMKPLEMESLCATKLPTLFNKIVCVTVRKIIRVQPGLQSSVQIPQELC